MCLFHCDAEFVESIYLTKESVCCICNEFVYTSLCFYHANSDIVSQHKYGEMKQI